MSTEPTAITIRKPPAEAIRQLERVVLEGNLATLNEGERVAYYARVCESLGLNPLTRPFEYITLNNKLTLYARKDATDQLRDLHGVSVEDLTREFDDERGLYTVIAAVVDRYGRRDSGMGVTNIAGLKGEALANAMMKAETKAKRRGTLSICGLGWMDEVEALDARAIEVAPRAELAQGIRARTRALTSGSSEAPSEAVPVAGEVVPPPSPAASSDSGEATAHVHVPAAEVNADGDVVCVDCGLVMAERPPKARARKAKALKPGDDGYGTARAHAVAAERGLDHDAVHRIAAAVHDREEDPDFTVSELLEGEWLDVIAAIAEATVTDDVSVAEQFAGRMALQAGLGDDNDPWPTADPILAAMFGHGDPFSAAELIEFGIRIYARNPLP